MLPLLAPGNGASARGSASPGDAALAVYPLALVVDGVAAAVQQALHAIL